MENSHCGSDPNYINSNQLTRLLKPGLGIRSFAHSSFAHLLISLKSNERLWAIRSDRSRQMSDCEQIAQVAQRKWATVSESLRSLKKIWLNKSKILFFSVFYIYFFK